MLLTALVSECWPFDAVYFVSCRCARCELASCRTAVVPDGRELREIIVRTVAVAASLDSRLRVPASLRL